MDIPRAQSHTFVTSTKLFEPDNVAKSDTKEEKDSSRSKKRKMFSSTPESTLDTGTKQKRSRNIYGQNEPQRTDAYQTAFDEKEEAAPVFRQQEIASPRVVVENTVLFPAADFSLDATFTHNSSSEERLEQIVFDSNMRRSNIMKTRHSITANISRVDAWGKLRTSRLKDLNGLDKIQLNNIASKAGIEMDRINLDSNNTNDILMERAREWITKEMDRCFSQSIDDTLDPKMRKLAVEKLRNITEKIKLFESSSTPIQNSESLSLVNLSPTSSPENRPNIGPASLSSSCAPASSSNLSA
eukprot:CAMPEP_0194347194 /NCGR_PEP_ID=MMETSP0171-20130528/105852_1 /TAXON_ID=218684 /ORGANISM="Corethron pennatum, Strain L29A3" /LENGTH=298 /DNA_ID=CAMNT_0039114415 /DNA_START=957 /DNA_END=1849 /DNA_ORIENTATION=-